MPSSIMACIGDSTDSFCLHCIVCIYKTLCSSLMASIVLLQVGVSETQLSALQQGTFAQLHNCTPGSHDTCTVCQEQVAAEETLTQLPCKHTFHHNCIAQWFDSSKMCPVCMTEVRGGSEAGQAGDAGASALAQDSTDK